MHATSAGRCSSDWLVMVAGTFGHAHEPATSLPELGTAAFLLETGNSFQTFLWKLGIGPDLLLTALCLPVISPLFSSQIAFHFSALQPTLSGWELRGLLHNTSWATTPTSFGDTPGDSDSGRYLPSQIAIPYQPNPLAGCVAHRLWRWPAESFEA